MSLKPSIGQIVNPFFLQDSQDANPSAVSYPLNVADGVKGGSSAVDPLSLDIAGLPAGTLATTTELAINNGTVNEKTTLSDLATFLDGGTPTEVRYFDNAGVDYSDPLFTRDSVTNYTIANREYYSTANINTVTSPASFLTTNTNGTFTIGDQVETQFGEAQAEVLDVNTFVKNKMLYTNLVYTGVGLNDLTSIYAGGYTGGIFPVTYTMEILQNNVAYSGIGGVNGTLSIGDTITGLISGATAVIVAIDTFKNILAVDTIVGTFIPSEIVQGNTPSDFVSIGGDFSTLADIVLISNTNANSIITTIAPTSQLEGVQTSFSSFTGHTIGDTWTFDISPTTTFTIVYLTNITGTLPISSNTRLNNLTTPFQTGDGNIIASQFTIGDTVNVIDLSGSTTIGNIQITGVSGDVFQYVLNSGTISLGNYLYSGTQGKQGFVYDINSTTVTTTIRTGFETQEVVFPVIPFPLQGSALTSDNGSDKAGIGVFDFTPLGQEDAVPAIIKFYADGSQGTFQVTKNALYANGYDLTNNRSFDFYFTPTEISFNGFDGSNSINISLTQSQLGYRTNGGTGFSFPNTYNGPVSVMTDMSGNGNFTLEPISSLINIDTIYTADGTLTSDRSVNMTNLSLKFIGNNTYGESVFFGSMDNYQTSSIRATGYSHGYNGGIRSQSIAYEPSQFVYEQYTGVGDFSNTLPNKSRTIYRHDSNTAVSTVNTRLVESTSSDSIFDETVTANGSNITSLNTYTLASGEVVSESVDTLVGEFIRTVSDSLNTNTYTQTKTGFGYSKYGNTRDDTGTTTPINFIYTDGTGEFLSAPLSATISTEIANYTVVPADQWNIIHIDNSGGAIDITLPDPATVIVGKVFRFKAVGNSSNTVRFIPFGAESIDLIAGAYTWSNPLGLQYLETYTDGTNWFIS